ncbi:hypothetical protein FHR81_002268 [Actinoalloteichus hoggarensis]|uniref:hypothetical protein n=1 Tax=Actinoalloteichus hoggarensis TaxID=1470176 RepID=UPI0012FDA793|nr:hypothetical protein [Actinoalloteichus hoggarensis]MBB5921230.1 hypothetical protein [Actinoalloteichus hoggarensis]
MVVLVELPAPSGEGRRRAAGPAESSSTPAITAPVKVTVAGRPRRVAESDAVDRG